jgi:hypothetical protein
MILKLQTLKSIALFVFLTMGWTLTFSGFSPSQAQNEKEVLTRGEAILLLSATDFVKNKINELLSWTIGYDVSKVSRVKLTPTINFIKATPKKLPPDGRTILEIVASVDDPEGLANISGVRADLSSIGRLANTQLVDNGLYGDEKAADGIYTLQTSVSTKIDLGAKEISVAVANKDGWVALAKTNLDVKKNPKIDKIRLSPESVPADGKSKALLTVRIENPGRIQDIKSVEADMKALGYSKPLVLHNDGLNGDEKAGDDIFSLQFVVPDIVNSGEYPINIMVYNLVGGHASGDLILKVYK